MRYKVQSWLVTFALAMSLPSFARNGLVDADHSREMSKAAMAEIEGYFEKSVSHFSKGLTTPGR